MKLALQYSETINGKFSPGDLNLMMVFQLNCPGCFMYGFPLMNQLHAKHMSSLSFFSLSTAFEDFIINTPANTRLLMNKGEFVGETRKAYDAGLFSWWQPSFPILVDDAVSQSQLLEQTFIDSIVQNRKELLTEREFEKEKFRTALRDYFRKLPSSGYTFTANLMQGTPTFILFNNHMEILLEWFGHANANVIEEKLATFIYQKKRNE